MFDDVTKELEKRNWIVRLPESELFVFRSEMTKLITLLKAILINAVNANSNARYRFEEWIFPRIVPTHILARTGWLTHHREEAWGLEKSRQIEFRKCEFGGESDRIFNSEEMFPDARHSYSLDPIQCVSFYYAHFGKKIRETDGPICVYEHQGGWTHRYETRPDGIWCGLGFMRLEFVWLASKLDVEKIQSHLIALTWDALRSRVGLDRQVDLAASDSCFIQQDVDGYKKVYTREEARDTRNASTKTNLFNLPSESYDLVYRRPSDSDAKLYEIASSGRHRELPKNFKIELDSASGRNGSIWSGCFGVGLNRLAMAFLDMHGFDPARWPTDMQDMFKA